MTPRLPLVLLLSMAALTAARLPAAAQDLPVVFIHGIFASDASWQETAQRLTGQLAIAPHLTNQNGSDTYNTQANHVQATLGGLNGSTIAVGHSNGGMVARQWSRTHPLSAILTIGTPHRGAPLVYNFYSYLSFNYGLLDAMNRVFVSFGQNCCSWSWVIEYLTSYLDLMSNLAGASMLDIISSVGINYSNPVVAQMMPGSSFLADINSSANLVRESAQVPSRIGIVSVAHNFYWGGPLRAAFPDDGDLWATWRDITMTGLDYFAFYIWTNAPFGDLRSLDIANALWAAAGWLGSMDEWWCQTVSMAGYGMCWANDTVVPEWSQDYGALGALSIHTGWDGPAHTQETRMSDYLIYYALTNFASVPRRQAAPPPPPATPTLSINRPQFCSSDTDWVASIAAAPANSSVYLYEERWVNDHWVYNWEGSVGYTDANGQLTIVASPPITGAGWYRSWVVVAGASSNSVEYEVVC